MWLSSRTCASCKFLDSLAVDEGISLTLRRKLWTSSVGRVPNEKARRFHEAWAWMEHRCAWDSSAQQALLTVLRVPSVPQLYSNHRSLTLSRMQERLSTTKSSSSLQPQTLISYILPPLTYGPGCQSYTRLRIWYPQHRSETYLLFSIVFFFLPFIHTRHHDTMILHEIFFSR